MNWWFGFHNCCYNLVHFGQIQVYKLYRGMCVNLDKTASDLVKEMEEKKMVLNRKVRLPTFCRLSCLS